MPTPDCIAIAPSEEIVAELDLVLVMTVDPGSAGRAFIASVLPKIRRVRDLVDRIRPECEVQVDGGIDAITAPLVVAEGASVLVAFGDSGGIGPAIGWLRASVAVGGERRSGCR
jgi:ribulose-phosphate 3-epimerase